MIRLAGTFVRLVGGTTFVPADERGWFGLVVLLMMVPTVVLQTRHNARVKD
jgi:hypothetical protein